jgi:hypothetical protein
MAMDSTSISPTTEPGVKTDLTVTKGPAARRRATEDFPISVADQRGIMLQVAGFDPERLGVAARRGFEKLMALLDAKVTRFATHEGAITDRLECEDNETQRKAAVSLVELGFEVFPSSTKPTGPSGTTVIDLSGWTVKRDET